MQMLRHDHIPVNPKPKTAPHPLQGCLKDASACVGGKQTAAMVTAESDEMTLPAVLKSRESPCMRTI